MKKRDELKVILYALAAYIACTGVFFLFSWYQIKSKETLKEKIEDLELEVNEFNKLDTIRSQVFYLLSNDIKGDFNNNYHRFWSEISQYKTYKPDEQVHLNFYFHAISFGRLPELNIDHSLKKAKFFYDARYFELKEKYSINSPQDFYEIVDSARFHPSDLDVFFYLNKKKKELSYLNPPSNKLFVFDYWLDFLIIILGLLSIRYIILIALFIKRNISKFNFKGFYSKNKISIGIALLVLFLTKPDSKDFEEMGIDAYEKKFDAIIFNCYETDEGIYIGILGNAIWISD